MKISHPFLIVLQACLIAGLLLIGLNSRDEGKSLPGTDLEETRGESIKVLDLTGDAPDQMDWVAPSVEKNYWAYRHPLGVSLLSINLHQSDCRFSWIIPLRI